VKLYDYVGNTTALTTGKKEECKGREEDTHVGFARQGFGSRRATGVASVRSCWKHPLHPRDLQAKAEPISDGGSTSVITDLRRWNSRRREE